MNQRLEHTMVHASKDVLAKSVEHRVNIGCRIHGGDRTRGQGDHAARGLRLAFVSVQLENSAARFPMGRAARLGVLSHRRSNPNAARGALRPPSTVAALASLA